MRKGLCLSHLTPGRLEHLHRGRLGGGVIPLRLLPMEASQGFSQGRYRGGQLGLGLGVCRVCMDTTPQMPARSPDELNLAAAELTLFMHNLAPMDIWNGTDQRREDLASVR